MRTDKRSLTDAQSDLLSGVGETEEESLVAIHKLQREVSELRRGADGGSQPALPYIGRGEQGGGGKHNAHAKVIG